MTSHRKVTPIIGRLDWGFNFCQSVNQWHKSELCSINGISDCQFSISSRCNRRNSFDNSYFLEILIHKTDKKAVRADITVAVFVSSTDIREEKNKVLDAWTEVCLFTDFDKFRNTWNSDIMQVQCTIKWYHSEAPLPSNLHDDVKSFLFQSTLSDFTMVIGKEAIPIHKLVLAAHSSVFLNMFQSDMKEAKESRIVIEDITPDIMKNVLLFLYTGCDNALDNPQMALDILVVAERYDMKKLKRLCEYKLSKKIIASNALILLDHADNHNAEELKDACLQFIVDNRRQIVDTPNFERLCIKKPKLMYEFMKDALKK